MTVESDLRYTDEEFRGFLSWWMQADLSERQTNPRSISATSQEVAEASLGQEARRRGYQDITEAYYSFIPR